MGQLLDVRRYREWFGPKIWLYWLGSVMTENGTKMGSESKAKTAALIFFFNS